MKGYLRTIKRKWLLNSSRVHLMALNERFAQSTTSDAYVLDAGAGSAPYEKLFKHTNYETADIELLQKQYSATTYVCDLASMPMEDGRYDFVVFNQVLEHVPNPLAVLKELFRVMKTGGRMICTCPLFYEEHETPYDYYRYTQFAHKHLFEEAGFHIEQIDWV